MEAHTTLKTVRQPATVIEILEMANPTQPTSPEPIAKTAGLDRSQPESQHENSEQFREDIRRRHEQLFRLHGWPHRGLND
jgi:hypothetical protein